jgi:hypothetical protein
MIAASTGCGGRSSDEPAHSVPREPSKSWLCMSPGRVKVKRHVGPASGRPQRLHRQLDPRPSLVHRVPVRLSPWLPCHCWRAAGPARCQRAAGSRRRPPEPLLLAGAVPRRLPPAGRPAERAVHRHWRSPPVGSAATMTTVLAVWYAGIADRWADNSPLDVGFSLLEQANTWIWVLALLGTGRACSPAPVRGLGYASEASFPALCCTRPSSSRSPRRGGLGSRRGVEVRDHLPGRACPAPAAVRGPGPPDQRDRFLFGMQPRRPEASPTAPVPALPKATNDLPIAPRYPTAAAVDAELVRLDASDRWPPRSDRNLPAAEDGVGDRPPYRPYSTIPRPVGRSV